MPFDSLKSLQNNYATQVLDRAFSRFSCKRDTDIEHFLRNRAVQFEELAKSRTYLFVDDSALENNQIEIAAFFSIAPQILYLSEELSIRQIKRLDGFSGKMHGERIPALPVMLIGQLAKNDACECGVTGKEILRLALAITRKAHDAIGGRIVMVDVKTEAVGLIRFYEEHDFVLISEDPETGLSQMIYMLC